jgi:hypothetical protein
LEFVWSLVGAFCGGSIGERREGNVCGKDVDVAAHERGCRHQMGAGGGGGLVELVRHRAAQEGPQRAEEGSDAGPEFRAGGGDVHALKMGAAGTRADKAR